MTQPSQVPAADDFVNHWNVIMKIAKDSLMEAQDRQAKYANQHKRHQVFKEGDQVLLSMCNINNPVDRNQPTKKLTNRFAGPYIITKVISTTAYKLDLPNTMKIHPVFHVSLLKPYQPSSTDFEKLTLSPAIIIPETDHKEYEVK